jgi:hypothetical protein
MRLISRLEYDARPGISGREAVGHLRKPRRIVDLRRGVIRRSEKVADFPGRIVLKFETLEGATSFDLNR